MHSHITNVIASLVLALLCLTSIGSSDVSAQCTSEQYTYNFTNYCSYPIWIGQSANVSNNQSYPPQGGNWAVAGRCTSNSECSPHTCDQSTGQCTCNTSSDCAGGATCQTSGTCSTTATFCMPQHWTSGTFWPRTSCTPVGTTGLNCLTGQCTPKGATDGLMDCGVGITSPHSPVTQFEVTSAFDPNAKTGSANYDVSIASGANVEMKVTPVGGYFPLPGVGVPDNEVACYPAGCTADLNATCPVNLQVKSGNTVIGCLDPCTQCQRTQPKGSTQFCSTLPAPGGSAPDATIYAALMCDKPITTDISGNAPATTVTCGTTGGVGHPTYLDMYCAANFCDTGSPAPGDSGNPAQASGNQGTATAFSQSDCFPGETYVVPTFASGYKGPAGAGVCVYASPPQNGIPGFNDFGWFDNSSQTTKNCRDLLDGTACGGYLTGQVDTGGTATYPSALGYTCQTAMALYNDNLGHPQTAHLCMPPTTSGLGTCTYDSLGFKPLYTGVGGVYNASWLTAGLQAGGAVPYYQTFKQACGASYTWQYDDDASGFACFTPPAQGKGQVFSGFNVTFCQSRSLGATPVAEIGFTGRGRTVNVGVAGNRGTVYITGQFNLPGNVQLDLATINLTDLLDEVAGAGELVDGLPITLDATPSSKPGYAVFQTPPATRPDVKMKISKRQQAGELAFSIAVDHATISQAATCSVANIETGFDLMIGARKVHVTATLPWRCHGRNLDTP